MNYCDISFEEEPESYKQLVELKEYAENFLRALHRGEHILPKKIALILNWILYGSGGCFCEVKKTGYKRFRNKKWHSMVHLYTQDIRAVETILCEIYGEYVQMKVNKMDPFEDYPLDKDRWMKISIPYTTLLPVLIDGVESIIAVTMENMDDYEGEDKYYE